MFRDFYTKQVNKLVTKSAEDAIKSKTQKKNQAFEFVEKMNEKIF